MLNRILLTLSLSIFLSLSIVPVYAAPSLSLGSTASYTISGNVSIYQACSTSPVLYTQQACNGAGSPQSSYVQINDSGQCGPLNSTSIDCQFVPSDITIPSGTWLYWINEGILTHEVQENLSRSQGPLQGVLGPLSRGQDAGLLFDQVGTFYFYDPLYPKALGLRGTVTVVSPTPPVIPPPTSINIGLTGTIGWTVEGLSTSQANLLVSHNIAGSVSPIAILTFTPITESGSYEQSVNLSTRVESPGTASGLVMTILTSPALSGIFRYDSYGFAPQVFSTATDTEPSYTQWWVNGPLSNGSPVQILEGWSSVTSGQSLDLGGSVGTRQAWIVTSKLSQTFNLNIPNVNTPLGPASASTANAELGFQWSFDKSTDLLLKNNDTISISTRSVNPSTVYVGSGPVDVRVTRTISATVTLTVQLSSTSLNLNSSQQTPGLNPISPMSWMTVGLVGLVAGVVSAALLWQGYRSRRSAAPTTTPTPPIPY